MSQGRPLTGSPRIHGDILVLLFDAFDTSQSVDRVACAKGALVCRDWADPALAALWRSLWGSLLPLYGLLLSVPDIVRRSHRGGFHGSHINISYIEYIGKVRVVV